MHDFDKVMYYFHAGTAVATASTGVAQGRHCVVQGRRDAVPAGVPPLLSSPSP